MFTGIVEEVGFIRSLNRTGRAMKMIISCSKVLDKTKIGDSIAVNGVCLTLTSLDKDSFTVDIMPETVRKSALNNLKINSRVNLERALMVDERFGGHIVTGHIDGIGSIANLEKEDNAIVITILTTADIMKYLILKGSVTLDGISLTICYVGENIFKVSIIPHTMDATCLGSKFIGDYINIECDIIGKYVEKLLVNNTNNKSNITYDFLRENGFA